MSLIKGMLMSSYIKFSINFQYCLSSLVFLILWGIGEACISYTNFLDELDCDALVDTSVVIDNATCDFLFGCPRLAISSFSMTMMEGFGSTFRVTIYVASVDSFIITSWFTYFLLGLHTPYCRNTKKYLSVRML